MKKRLALAAAFACFLALEYALYLYADRPLAQAAFGLDKDRHALIEFFRAITDFGKGAWYLWPTGILTLFAAFLIRGKDVPQRWRNLCGYIGTRVFFVFAAVAVSGIAADILKPIAGRARPHLWLFKGIYGFDPFNARGMLWEGMPSGHSTTVFAFAAAMTRLYPRLWPLWFSYAVFLGASRIMVDAHFLSDVLAGALLGAATVYLLRGQRINHLMRVIFPIDTPPRLR